MAFTTDAEVKASVVAALNKAVADVDATKWDRICADANLAAYSLILIHFKKLGYTTAQIDAWDQGITFNKFLARYQALMDGAGDQDRGEEWRTELDFWRGLLTDLTEMIDGGVVIDPAADAEASVGHGNLSTTSDLFSLDPDDERRGEPTEW